MSGRRQSIVSSYIEQQIAARDAVTGTAFQLTDCAGLPDDVSKTTNDDRSFALALWKTVQLVLAK